MILKQNNLIGFILIAVGALALLSNVGLFDAPTLIFSLAMAAGGIYLVRYYLLDKKQFWASITGFTLLGLALAAMSGALSGFYFLAMLGAGFAFTYFIQRKHWWAVIPAGALFTLALVAGSETVFPRWDAGPLFFAGLGATFGYLYLLEHKRWAIYPAVALLVVGLISVSFTGGWVFPVLLIVAGLYAFKGRTLPTVTAPYATKPNGAKPVENVEMVKPSETQPLQTVAQVTEEAKAVTVTALPSNTITAAPPDETKPSKDDKQNS